MVTLKSTTILFAFLLSVAVAFGQKADSTGSYNPTTKTNEINNAANKLPYLQSFLETIKSNPAKYCKASKKLRDSVNTHTQIDFQTLLLSVFGDYKYKNIEKIQAETKKAWGISLQMINAGEFLADQQKELELHIVKINNLIAQTGVFKQGS